MTGNNIKILSWSDVHNGHSKVGPNVMSHNIRSIVYPLLNDDLDLMIIAGDFFDRLHDMNGDEGHTVAQLINEMRELANQHGFLIRVLRGTFSHDRMQNRFFAIESDHTMLGNDKLVRVFDNIEIEHIDGLGISIMYVPDDLPYDNATEVVQEKLKAAQMTKVDFIVNHGYFEHLIPRNMPVLPINTFNADVIGALVHGVVLNGHIHQPSVYKKVINHGSFERLNHGEEEPKGIFMLTYSPSDKEISYDFIENTLATTFKTFNIDKFSEDEIYDVFTKWMKDVANNKSTHPNTFIRLVGEDKLLIAALISHAKDTHDNVIFTIKSKKKQTTVDDININIDDLPVLTEQNITIHLCQFINDNLSVKYERADVERILSYVI